MGISVGVRKMVFSTAVAAVVIMPVGVAGAADEDASDPSRLALKRIFSDREFRVATFGPARWLADGSGYTTLEDTADFKDRKDIIHYDPATGDRAVLVAASQLVPEGAERPLAIDDYQWSEDGRKLLIFTNGQRVWRRNTRGDYWLLERESGSLRQLGGDVEPTTMMFAKLSPAGDRVAWVDFSEKDIFVQDLETLAVSRLTTGSSQTVINGTSDWVYEEEFGLRDGFRWSPDGRHIAYWQFDTEGVPVFQIINNTDTIYPELTSIQYPKVGQTNSACRVGVVETSGGETTWFEPEGDPRDHYIPKMEWAGDSNEVMLIRLNRLQNTAEVILGDVRTGSVRTVFADTDEAWVDMRRSPPEWFDGGRWFTWLSERDGWRHLYLVSRTGDEVRLVTPGDYDVLGLEKLDVAGGWAYISASPTEPTRRFLFRVPLDGTGKLERLTPADAQGSHVYQISDDARWAIHTWSSYERVPETDLVSLPDHAHRRILEANTGVQTAVDVLAKMPVETFRVDIGHGVGLDGWCIKPPDFDPGKRYPLLIYVYGEPASQTVRDRWGGDTQLWHLLLAQRGVIVASLDNRGTPAPRGRAWRKAVYRQIGILASADQAAGLRAMLASRPYIDRRRVGIWGWSGGGSMTLERPLPLPGALLPRDGHRLHQRPEGLRHHLPGALYGSSGRQRRRLHQWVSHHLCDQLEGDLLLVHGTGDDNCHYQSFELLVNELIRHNKQFTMMSYPNRTHGISEGENTTLHLFTLLTRFLEQRFVADLRPIRVDSHDPSVARSGARLVEWTAAPSISGPGGSGSFVGSSASFVDSKFWYYLKREFSGTLSEEDVRNEISICHVCGLVDGDGGICGRPGQGCREFRCSGGRRGHRWPGRLRLPVHRLHREYWTGAHLQLGGHHRHRDRVGLGRRRRGQYPGRFQFPVLRGGLHQRSGWQQWRGPVVRNRRCLGGQYMSHALYGPRASGLLGFLG